MKTLCNLIVHYGTAIKRMRVQSSLHGICQEKRQNFPKSNILGDLKEQDVFEVNLSSK